MPRHIYLRTVHRNHKNKITVPILSKEHMQNPDGSDVFGQVRTVIYI